MSNKIDQNPKKYGYARVSSKSQEVNSSLESQKQELVRNGILESNIIMEVGSAANEIRNRPGFQNLIQNVLKEGDTLVVTKIDRRARNTLEFLKLQDILFKRKIQFISLDLPYSEDLNINKLISTTLSSIAEFETNRRKERQMQEIYAAKKLANIVDGKRLLQKN